ncbi:MAG: DNA modification methylase [Patescibacteria group bacterium]
MNKEHIKIEMVPIDQLRLCEYNPRNLSEKREKDLTESIKRFGLVDALIVNKNISRKNVLIGGHQRYAIAKKLGYTEMPVVFVDLPLEKEKELNLRLNRNTGEWNLDLLREFDIDLLLDIGFDDNDLAGIWDENLEIEDDNFDSEKELEKAKETDIKVGDYFALGNHRLICGDSTDLGVVEKLMDGSKANMIYSDPPFNIGLDYAKGLGGKRNYGGKVNDSKSDSEYKDFLKKTILNAITVSKEDLHIFYYCDQKFIGILQELYREIGIDNKRVCLWVKNGINPTPDIAFNKCYEPCVYGIKGKPYLSDIKNLNEILNHEVGTGNRTIDDILDMLDIWLVKRLPGQDYEHPTEKSPTLHEKALRRCTKVNDIILDLFGGSGSTMCACHQLKRRCFTAEINPLFCQLIINRFEKYANTKARKLN